MAAMRERTTVELKVSTYPLSTDSLKPFGFTAVRGNRVLKSYLLHDWRVISGWPSVRQTTKDWLERVAREKGWH